MALYLAGVFQECTLPHGIDVGTPVRPQRNHGAAGCAMSAGDGRRDGGGGGDEARGSHVVQRVVDCAKHTRV